MCYSSSSEVTLSTWFIDFMIVVVLCLNLEGSPVTATSTKTVYYVSTNKVENHIIASRNCYQLGGNLIDLESSRTGAFLLKLSKALDPVVNNNDLYYTGLRYDSVSFMWIKETCLLNHKNKALTFANNFTPGSVLALQLRYVPGTTGHLGENFDGFWNTPVADQHALICEVSNTAQCSFIERTNVGVDSTLEVDYYYGMDLGTCIAHCDDECGIYMYILISRACTLWRVGALSKPVDYIVESDNQLTVYYKDCVELQFFEAETLRVGNSYLPCNFEKPTARVSKVTSMETSTFGWDLKTSTPTIEDVIGITAVDVINKNPTHGPTETLTDDSKIDIISTRELTTLRMSTEPFSTTVWTNLPVSSRETLPQKMSVSSRETFLSSTPIGSEKTLKNVTCQCICRKGYSDSLAAKMKFTSEILSNLTIDKRNISANTRKYVSIKDDRPSAISIGGFGAVFLGIVLSVPVLSDLLNLSVFLSNIWKKSITKTSVTEINITPD